MSARTHPRLRADLRVDPLRPGRPRAVEDPRTGHAVQLAAAWEQRALDLLDGTRALPEVAAVLGDAAPPGPALAYLVKRLRYLHLLDDADAALLARIERARRDPAAHAASVPWSAPRGARFRCQSSTGCCRSFQLGPITEACARTIDALPGLEQRFPALAGRPRTKRLAIGRDTLRYLHGRADGRCVFLLEDGRCGIHDAYGADQKPLMCRAFPHSVRLLLDRKEVYDRGHCHAYGTSAFEGPTLVERLADEPGLYEALLAQESLYHPQVSLDGYLELDYAYYAPFERHLCALAEELDEGPARLLGAVREAIHDLLDALAAPDDDGEGSRASPATRIAAVAGKPAAARLRADAPPPDRTEGLRHLGGLLQVLARAVRLSVSSSPRFGIGHTEPERFEPLLRGLEAAALAAFAEAEGRPPEALAEAGSQVGADAAELARVRLDLDAPRTRLRLRWLVRDLVVADELIEEPTLTGRFAALAGLVAALLAVARRLAAAAGRAEVAPPDLDAAQALAVRAFRLARGAGARFPQGLARGVVMHFALPAVLLA